MTLSQALKEGHKRGVVAWELRVKESDGLVKFYIHPMSVSGVTLDFALDQAVDGEELLLADPQNANAVWPE